MEARVKDVIEPLKLLLISYDAGKPLLLKQAVCTGVSTCNLSRVEPGPGALASATGRTGDPNEPLPDIILLDLETTEAAMVAVAKRLATDDTRPPVPLVLLTTCESERELRSGRLPIDDSRIFEATSLAGFAKNLARHKPKRFLRALSILSKLGPVLVRMPGESQLAVENSAA